MKTAAGVGRLVAGIVRGESGGLAVTAALIFSAFAALTGFAVDYGLLLVQRTNAQNAVDAASLAGSRWLLAGPNPGPAAATVAADQYLARYGYQQDAQTAVVISFPPSPTGANDQLKVQINRAQPTYFAQLIGVHSFAVQASATARASRSLTDIGLSLDLTGSMMLSGTDDLGQLRRAVVEFINDVNPDPAAADSPQIAMARFGGIMCGWNRTSPTEQFIELGPGPSEYVGPCADDQTVLTNLTKSKQLLLTLANNAGSASCPPGMSVYACPLNSWTYAAKDVNGSGATAQGMSWGGSQLTSLNPTYTGTKEPNAISVFSNSSYYAWSTANGGRNAAGGGYAHKVLVMITDGNDELWPWEGMPGGVSASAWDTQVVQMANTLKLGADGVAGTPDDVEVYVVGFYCTPYSTNPASGTSPNWCTSRMADTAAPHPCPSATWSPALASATDVLLYNISSSSPGSCDHYFPIKKTEDLPSAFQQIAGEIARGRLVK